MTRRLGTAALLAACLGVPGLGLSGCDANGGSGGRPTATASMIDPAAAQPHQLFTHCGVIWTQFLGKSWFASPPLSDGSGNPPAGFGNPVDHGTIQVVGPHQLRYVSSGGRTVTFVDTLPPGASPPGLCD